MNKYPSLFVSLEPSTGADGSRGSLVRSSTSRAALGFVWWSTSTGTVVTWHFRTATGGRETSGTRTTERNAVQALCDIAHGRTAFDFEDRSDAPTADAPVFSPARRERVERVPLTKSERAPSTAPVVVVAPVVAKRSIVWNDSAPAFDVTAAIAAALAKKVRP